MRKRVGIILKNYQSDQQRFSVLDRNDGKITCMLYNSSIVKGGLISYFTSTDTGTRIVTGVEVLDIPFTLARHDILLLHHVLELCYYFLPIQSEAEATFDLLMFLYRAADKLTTPLRKKIFLCKLHVSFGCYTDYAPLSMMFFSRLHSESIDSIVQVSLRLEIERKVDAWLYSCLREHPCFRNFKTVHFFDKNRLP